MSGHTDPYFWGAVLWKDPLIVISKLGRHGALGLASLKPELFADRKCLHLLGLTWSLETGDTLKPLLRELEEARSKLPQCNFVILTNTEYENFILSREGVPSILANELIFVDERKFRPLAAGSRSGRFDSVYVARPDPDKRYELCSRLNRVAFVYGQWATNHEAQTKSLMERFPNATFVNHEIGSGNYVWMGPEDVNAILNQSLTGLCLSEVEGAMRASMEYLLAGLPVVSTESKGGRDRYYSAPYCSVVPADPDAVDYGVKRLIERNFSRTQIREHVAQTVAFDRYNFLQNVNKVVEDYSGIPKMFPDFQPFVGKPVYPRLIAEICAEIENG